MTVMSKFLIKKKYNKSYDFLLKVQWFHSDPIRFFNFNNNYNLPHIGYVLQLIINKIGKIYPKVIFPSLSVNIAESLA